MKKWLSKHRIFTAAMGLFVWAHSWDMISTALAMAFVPGSMETNPLATDPVTRKAMFGALWGLKLLFAGLAVIPVGLAGALTESELAELAGGLFIAYCTIPVLEAAYGNFISLWFR